MFAMDGDLSVATPIRLFACPECDLPPGWIDVHEWASAGFPRPVAEVRHPSSFNIDFLGAELASHVPAPWGIGIEFSSCCEGCRATNETGTVWPNGDTAGEICVRCDYGAVNSCIWCGELLCREHSESVQYMYGPSGRRFVVHHAHECNPRPCGILDSQRLHDDEPDAEPPADEWIQVGRDRLPQPWEVAVPSSDSE